MGPNLIETVRFSELSEEVGRVIFELAALLDQETGRSCALVSRKINAWIEPILYRTLIIGDIEAMQRLCGIINHTTNSVTKSPDFFGRHVKAIAFINELEQDAADILSLLKACHGIEILVMWYTPHESEGSESDDGDLTDFITSPKLSPRRISIASNIFPIDAVHFSYHIFQNATHVELVWDGRGGDPDEVRWDTLRNLPCLTHLSVYPQFPMDECDRWVRETVNLCPPSLRVFILWLDSPAYFRVDGPPDRNRRSEEFAGVKAIQDGGIDSRAVVAFMGIFSPEPCDVHPIIRSHSDGTKDCAGIPDGKDFWTLAEELIEERLSRRGTQHDGTDLPGS